MRGLLVFGSWKTSTDMSPRAILAMDVPPVVTGLAQSGLAPVLAEPPAGLAGALAVLTASGAADAGAAEGGGAASCETSGSLPQPVSASTAAALRQRVTRRSFAPGRVLMDIGPRSPADTTAEGNAQCRCNPAFRKLTPKRGRPGRAITTFLGGQVGRLAAAVPVTQPLGSAGVPAAEEGRLGCDWSGRGSASQSISG